MAKKKKYWTFNSQKDRRLENLDGTSIWRTYHNDVLGITNDILRPSNSKLHVKELITKASM